MAEFDALVARTLNGIRSAEPDTLIYVSHAVDGSPDVRVFYELYRDRDAFDVHEQQPHTRAFLDQRTEYVESFEVDLLEAIDIKSTG